MLNMFKLLVEFNGQKYTVVVETEFKLITFRKVCNEIRCQIKQIVSFDTHLFEVYDPDFEEYVVVTDHNHLVENLSKIRVTLKETESKTHCFNGDNKHINGSVNPISIDKSQPKESLSDNSSANSKELTLEEKVKALNLFVTDDKPEDKPTVKTSANGLICADTGLKAMNLNNISLSFKKPEKSVKSLIKNVNNLKINDNMEVAISSTVDNSNDWAAVPNHPKVEDKDQAINYLNLELSATYIRSVTYKVLSYKTYVLEVHNQKVIGMRFSNEEFKAIRQMLDLMDANRSLFEANRFSNSVDSPKWQMISEMMVSNGFDGWTPQKCRDCFRSAIDLYRLTMDKCPDFDTADAINPLFFVLHSYDMKNVLGVRQFQAVKDLRNSFQLKCDKSQNSCGQSPNTDSNVSLVSINVDFDNQKKLQNKELIDRSKLRKMQKMTDFDVNSFKALTKSVTMVNQQFGHISKVRNFWELVINQMKQNGYKDIDSFTARNVFNEYISDYYTLVLIRSTTFKNAKEVYPLFEFIHAMDLSQCLSYSSFARVKELRHNFAQKCCNF